MAIFRFFKMAAAAILDYCNFRFLTVGTLKSANCINVPNFVEIGQTVADIWWFFDFSSWRPPPCWIFQISNFWRSGGLRGQTCVAMPIFVEIGRTAAEIWRFFDFSTWRPPPSWIFQICNLTVGRLRRAELIRHAKFGRNWSNPGRDMAIFRFFKIAAATILNF